MSFAPLVDPRRRLRYAPGDTATGRADVLSAFGGIATLADMRREGVEACLTPDAPGRVEVAVTRLEEGI